MLALTYSEMKKAWEQNLLASEITPRTNAHRLLLFYAVECGLKTVLMKRGEKKRTDLLSQAIKECKHDINKLLNHLSAGGRLSLPHEIFIKEILDTRNNPEERKLKNGKINEMWRYGAKVIAIVNREGDEKINASDQDIENKLLEISKWISKELERL